MAGCHCSTLVMELRWLMDAEPTIFYVCQMDIHCAVVGDDAAWRERMESESGFNWTPHIKSHSAFPVSSRPMKENQEHITRWRDINSCLREVGHNLQANHLSVSVTGHMTSHMILRIHDLSQSVFLPPSLPTDGIGIIQMHLFIHQWIQNRCSLINSIRLSGSTIQAQANKGMNTRSL